MDSESLKDISCRYTPLDPIIRCFHSSVQEASPDAKLELRMGCSLADDLFGSLICFSVDRDSGSFWSTDRRSEGRQQMTLLAFDRNQTLVGAHRWPAGRAGTPGDLLADAPFGQAAVDFALLTHREWFAPGKVPKGLPRHEKAPAGVVKAELEILICGKSGVPSLWSPSK